MFERVRLRLAGTPWVLIAKVLISISVLSFLALYFRSSPYIKAIHLPTSFASKPELPPVTHIIETLIEQAFAHRDRILLTRSHDVADAARKYRQRRGRHPPPGFEEWMAYALDKNAIVVEDFFDRIYDDLNPFWSLEPEELRNQSAPAQWEHIISVRNHTATLKADGVDPMNRMGLWFPMIQELEKYLPDLDMPYNIMDESRSLVPWGEVEKMMIREKENRMMPPAMEVHSEYSTLPPVDEQRAKGYHFDPHWITGGSNEYWNLARDACAPDTPAYGVPAIHVEQDPPYMPSEFPAHSTAGYVSNWTSATDPCLHPHLRSLHGTFIESVSVRTSRQLMPLFGGSKLPMNNEILIPAAMYLSTEELYAGTGDRGPDWAHKTDTIIWRGVASGGRNKAETWTHFHRHRLLQMLNGTTVGYAERHNGTAETFSLPDAKAYQLEALRSSEDSLGTWVDTLADAGFTNLECFPPQPHPEGHLCPYTNPYFEVKQRVPMAEQFKHKYLIDVDGNSFSGRFRAFLLSSSLPIKSTIYSEWHDSRLIPWVHFVPMDNTYVDLYGIMAFFLAQDDDSIARRETKSYAQIVKQRDALAENIAIEGRYWAEHVLRREDMALYFWRLLLEWARLCDDRRLTLGWVNDLV